MRNLNDFQCIIVSVLSTITSTILFGIIERDLHLRAQSLPRGSPLTDSRKYPNEHPNEKMNEHPNERRTTTTNDDDDDDDEPNIEPRRKTANKDGEGMLTVRVNTRDLASGLFACKY